MIHSKRMLSFAAVASVAFASGALGQTKILLGYTGANAFLASFVAKEKGFFAKNGLDVTLQRIPTGSTIPAALFATASRSER